MVDIDTAFDNKLYYRSVGKVTNGREFDGNQVVTKSHPEKLVVVCISPESRASALPAPCTKLVGMPVAKFEFAGS